MIDLETMINRPAAAWTLADLRRIADGGIEETPRLEFKADFEGGAAERWRTRVDGVSDRSRDALGREIVALANAYGGVVLLGIRETRRDGRGISDGLGEVIPQVAACAARLEDALRSVVDPPLTLLEVHPVTADESGGGYIVLRTSQSLAGPHGFGRPPEAYVRRGTAAEPMTMRDLHHVFWESRTAIDRVEKAFARFDDELTSRATDRHYPPSVPPLVLFRISVVPDRAFGLTALPDLMSPRGPFRITEPPFPLRATRVLKFSGSEWLPIAGGVELKSRSGERVELILRAYSDGSMNLIGSHTTGDVDRPHYPDWYAEAAISTLFSAARFRRFVGRLDVSLNVEFAMRPSHKGLIRFIIDRDFAEDAQPMAHFSRTDRLTLASDSNFDDVAELLARQVSWACGHDANFKHLRLDSNLATAFAG